MAVVDLLETGSRIWRQSSSRTMSNLLRTSDSTLPSTIPAQVTVSHASSSGKDYATTVPDRPAVPIKEKVTHHSIELSWEECLNKANETEGKGDERVKVAVEEAGKDGSWNNVYLGYAKRNSFDGLEAWTQYTYRIRFINKHGPSEWSPSLTVFTSKEPYTAEHLHRAITLQDVCTLERVLESGHFREGIVDTPDKYGLSPLMVCAQKGYVEFIEILMKHGADVNYKNEAGKTGLMMAAYAGRTECLKELRHFGAKYEMRDRGGSTALHWAMDGGNMEIIDYMVQDGADLSCTDDNGWTPLLRIAAVTGNCEVGKLLVRLGADMTTKDRDGKTTLMIAVVNGHQGLVEVLLQNGVDILTENEFGKTAYEMALSMERRRLIKLLEDHMDKNGLKRF